MRSRFAAVLMALSAAALSAQTSTNARFQFEKTADVATAGPQRLDIDVPLLIGSRPFTVSRRGDRAMTQLGGLGDLRLFSNNIEVPYLMIPPRPDEPLFINGRILPIAPVDTRETRSSGFEVDVQAVTDVDAIDLEGIGAPFLKRFRLEGSGDRERWTQLVGEGTAFDLPEEGLRHTRFEFAAGAYRYLRVTWDDTSSARVDAPDQALVRRVTQSSPGPVLRAPTVITRRQSEPGRSRFRVTLPGSRLPIVALELTITGGNLLRDARVFEPGLVGQEAQPRLLGQTRLRRVVRDAAQADALVIPITTPIEPQLDLVVDDGDNPPLELTAVTAVFAEMPWIYFEAAAPGAIVARYGDVRLAPPRYDLEAARATIPAAPNRAAWRPQSPATLSIDEEGLPMPDTGSALATEGFGFARDIPDGSGGLIAVPLDAAVMAHSGVAPRSLRGIRIIDRAGMQIPYLLERRDEPLIVDAQIERHALPNDVQAGSPNSTNYLVHLPHPELPGARLVLTTRARVFKRMATLGVAMAAADRRPARFVPISTKPWIHADEATAAPSLTFDMPERPGGELYLVVEEGDNKPLPIEKATVLMPSYAVRLFRRPGLPLRMVYGNDRIGAPQYDLQLLAPQLLGRTAEEVNAGAERALSPAGDPTMELVSPIVFWSVLAVTVVVLLGLVVRLMKREAL
jgi:hypothetical protein